MIRRQRARVPAAPAARPAERFQGYGRAIAILALTLLACTLAVDLRAEAAFDAPKRLVASLGILITAGLVFGRAVWSGESLTRVRLLRIDLILLGVVAAACLISTLASPRPAVAFDGLRSLAIGGLLVAIGASEALDEGRVGPLAIAFLGGCAVNALTSLLQVGGLHLFDVQGLTGRADTGAFLGNDGYVGLLLALGCVLSVGLLANASSVRVRVAAALLTAFLFSGMAVNRSVTAFLALGAGALTILIGRFRSRAVIPLFGLLLVLTTVVAAWFPLRMRVNEMARAAFAGDWEEVASYRFGPWGAAAEMVRERPLTGWGPGTFAAEFTPHRLAAEARNRVRYLNPNLPGDAYVEAHNDALQSFAELGMPAGLALLLGFGLVLARLIRHVRVAGSGESLALLAFLVAGSAAALTWFPFHREFSSVPLLLTIGRGWRVGSGAE